MQKLLDGRPLRLQLVGLEHMSDDPSDMHVLYLQVHVLMQAGQGAACINLCPCALLQRESEQAPRCPAVLSPPPPHAQVKDLGPGQRLVQLAELVVQAFTAAGLTQPVSRQSAMRAVLASAAAAAAASAALACEFCCRRCPAVSRRRRHCSSSS